MFVDILWKKCFFLSIWNVEVVCKLNYNVIVMKIFIFRILNGIVKLFLFFCNLINCMIIYLVCDFWLVVFLYMKVGM